MTATPSQTVGPFFGFALGLIDGADGVRVEGQVLDGAGKPVADALLEVWFDDQFARCRTDDEGAFHCVVREAPFRNVTIFARGLLRQLDTRMYFPGAPSDEVLSMVELKRRHTRFARPDGGGLRFDIHLQGEDETVLFA